MTNEVKPTETAAPAAANPEYVTRADLTAAVTAAVEAALAKQVQRTDNTQTENTPAAPAAPAAEAKPEGVEAVIRSMEGMAEKFGAMAEKLGERIEKLEGTTVVRSDEGDGTEKKVVRKDVFKGMFGAGLGRS